MKTKRMIGIAMLIIFLFIAAYSHADTPPEWLTSYTIKSANGKYIAEVSPMVKGNQDRPWEWRYQVAVREAGNNSKQLWKTEYFHTGYCEGLLSNDGRYFVYVEFWYSSEGQLVTVYSSKGSKGWTASDLSISSWFLPKTVSHRLWLGEDNQYEFIENNGKTTGLILYTRKGKRTIAF